ncbi:DUF6414 family protein [Clostridium algidicarnis]|uniref:DUF6414 family protein n=1 Tax=Clostridium algidicarnis TaxID=37659 RepID=UPI001C0CD484|nr:DUF6414 family protein [Clostridium algidicarnis]MBU3202754.1 hypothetical protein [Clostridium algidicarnis]MBU3210908.1 hypothetical protein [Clostridium algidicarnis]MBU3222584.1 hypothetical protein [Clostridium algidicarnis]
MIKIIYFDDESATDILNIKNGGNLIETSVDEEGKKTEKEVHGKVNIGVGIKKLLGLLRAEGNISLDISTFKNNSKFIESTISNTILTDFINYVEGSEDDGILKLEDYKIEIAQNSIAYFQRLTPYLSMMDGDFDVDENLKLNVEKIHGGFEFAKGYYELIAKKDYTKSIFRFNNKSFKNNYYLTDLENMELVLYGIKVGKMNLESIDFIKSMDNWTNTSEMSMEDITNALESSDEEFINEKLASVYDIILAGVE